MKNKIKNILKDNGIALKKSEIGPFFGKLSFGSEKDLELFYNNAKLIKEISVKTIPKNNGGYKYNTIYIDNIESIKKENKKTMTVSSSESFNNSFKNINKVKDFLDEIAKKYNGISNIYFDTYDIEFNYRKLENNEELYQRLQKENNEYIKQEKKKIKEMKQLKELESKKLSGDYDNLNII